MKSKNMAKQPAKRRRSRFGCHACKKAKIKCDEKRPICTNCLKFHRHCDYSIVLTWGGRPYKKPKVEKLNVVASLSRKQLKQKSGRVDLFKTGLRKDKGPVIIQQDPASDIKKKRDETPELPKKRQCLRVGNSNDVATSFLSPSENLQYLLQMTEQRMGGDLSKKDDTKGKSVDKADEKLVDKLGDYQSLDESIIPQGHFNANFNESIKSMSSVIDNIISNDVIQTNPWGFLEDFENAIDPVFTSPKMASPIDTSPHPPEKNVDPPDFNDDLRQIASHLPDYQGKLRPVPMAEEARSEKSVNVATESIPRGLLPLPDMLLRVPYYYESFTFYTNSTSSLLTPADPDIYQDNPFKIVLPNLAMQNDALMSILIAFGISHRSTLLHEPLPVDVVESLMSRALRGLLALLNDSSTSTSDLTLTLVLLLSSFMVFAFNTDKWRVHLKGARQILLLRGYSKPFSKLLSDFKNDTSPTATNMSNEIKKSKLLYFLIRWFAYIDVFSSLSSPLEPTNEEINKFLAKKDRIRRRLSSDSSSQSTSPSVETLETVAFDYAESSQARSSQAQQAQQMDYNIGDEASFMKDESHKDIDYMLGFNIRFLPLYSQLCKLIKHINLCKRAEERESTELEFKLSPKIVERALEIELQFRKLGKVEFDTDYSTKSRSFNSIVAINHCFLLMGLIQLYRRVLQVPRGSNLVQEMSESIIGLTQDFVDTVNSPSSLCLILPMFVGGCECESVTKRRLYREKMKELAGQGSPSAPEAIEIMEECWKTGRDWCEVMYREKRTVVFM